MAEFIPCHGIAFLYKAEDCLKFILAKPRHTKERKAFLPRKKANLDILDVHVEREMNLQDENNAEDKLVEQVLYEFRIQQKQCGMKDKCAKATLIFQ